MTPAIAFIASCFVGAFIIEIRARALNLPPYKECRDSGRESCGCGNPKQNSTHFFSSSKVTALNPVA